MANISKLAIHGVFNFHTLRYFSFEKTNTILIQRGHCFFLVFYTKLFLKTFLYNHESKMSLWSVIVEFLKSTCKLVYIILTIVSGSDASSLEVHPHHECEPCDDAYYVHDPAVHS